MNRRLILVSASECPWYIELLNGDLGNDTYIIEALEKMDEGQRRLALALGPGDGAMLVGNEAFQYLKSFYHFGIRGEGFKECTKLWRLSIEGGAYVKCVKERPTQEDKSSFMDPNFTRDVDFNWYKQKVIHNLNDALKFLEWLDNTPEDEDFGFDYETSGMPLDKVFFVSGFSLCTIKYGAFISVTDIINRGEDIDKLKRPLAKFLLKRMSHIWTYNMQFEWLVSHRWLGIDLYELRDASVYNTLTGNHLEYFSLKWSAQYYLAAKVWDTEFDFLSDIIDSMLFEEVGRLKREKRKVLKITPQDFKNTPEWKEICRRYPNYVAEFEKLMIQFWGNPFMIIPSDILGYYCNLDSFYTLMIHVKMKEKYTQECIDTFSDNIRLGARLMGSGLYIDEPYRAKYEKYCEEMMAWGITYCATARCWIKMKKHKDKAANTKRYGPVALKLMKEGNFFSGNLIEILKYILTSNLDTLDTTDTGVNEGSILLEYGPDFANKFIAALKQRMKEIKFKGKIDETVVRKKKLLGLLSEDLKTILGLDKINVEGKSHQELEKYLYYERIYNELVKVSKNQLNDINNIPEIITAFGTKFNRLSYSEYICKNYFMCTSPIENDAIAEEFTRLYKYQTAFLSSMSESTQQLNNAEKFYSSRQINSIEQGFQEFMRQWEAYYKDPQKDIDFENKYIYPRKVFELALQHYKDVTSDKNKDMWTSFDGYNAQYQLFPDVQNQWAEYEAPFKETDLDDNFFFMRKLTVNYLVYKKYAKLDSTYVGSTGMFKKNNKFVIEGDDLIPIREADPDEPGAVEKCFVRYEVNKKSSKRWSSGFHTIISHGDLKDIMCPPPIEKGDYLLTYFDISSAEVKSAGYASGDPDLIRLFNAGIDVYIYSAKIYLGEDGWNRLNDKQKKTWRKRFKTIFLGVLYGLGKNSLAARLECSVEEAQRIIDSLYNSFPGLRKYVESQGEYPMNHGGRINTMLGDDLYVVEYTDYLPKATSEREKQNIIARIKRLGVNLPIQGGTSTIMACGFYNNIRVSLKEGWKNALHPIIVVH